MAWTTPRTWVVGEVLTAALLNTHLRDNLSYAHDSANPRARVYKNSAFSHNSTGNALSITFDTERYDTAVMHDTAALTHRLTVPTGGDGLYALGAGVEWDSNTTGLRIASIEYNGVNGGGTYLVRQQGSATANARLSMYTEFPLDASEYVACTVFQNSGGTRTVDRVAGHSPEFWCRWLALG